MIDARRVRIPCDRARFGSCGTANQAKNFMSSRREHWRERRADEACGAAQRDAHRRSAACRLVHLQIVRGDAVAVREHAVEFLSHHRTAEQCTERTHGQFVVNMIREPGRVFAVGLERVRVFPAFEWAGGLHVTELLAVDEAFVHGNPSCFDGASDACFDDCSAAVGNPANVFEQTYFFPRRGEALECAGARVPVECDARGDRQTRAFFEDRHGRSVAIIWPVV